MRHATKRAYGFTLIELLIVISIIAILAAILFPVFARARENARRASCASNEKQLALALRMYIQDYDDYFPFYDTGDGTMWTYTTYPYHKNFQLIRCPSAPQAKGWALHPDHGVSVTYALVGGPTVKNQILQYPPRKLSTIIYTSRTWMMVESRYGNDNYEKNGYGVANVRFLTSQTDHPEYYASNFTSQRHLDGSNVAFVDGHVKWIKHGDGKNWIWTLSLQD